MQTLDILYETEDYLVLDKPSGLIVHADGKREEETLVDWLLQAYPDIHDVGEPLILPNDQEIPRPGIVHRLDRETSGVLLVAKTQKAYEHFKKQFQERTVQKEYRAFVYGALKEKEGVIDKPIGRSKKHFNQWTAQPGSRGKQREAQTTYEVLGENENYSYLKLLPKTGRTHQLRVHMKALHHPIVADTLYAPKREPVLGFERLALHAHKLTFTDPEGEKHTIEASLTDDFEHARWLLCHC